jgi:membrane protease subunit (stomatin/prohibitin family)
MVVSFVMLVVKYIFYRRNGMALFGNKEKHNKGGLLGDMIMSPETDRDWLIYKWRPAGEDAGATKRENSIRIGSPLTVRPGESAVFLYMAQQQKLTGQSGGGLNQGGGGGNTLDIINGYFQGKVDTANLPVLSGIQGLLMGGGTSFPAMVYFINTAGANQIQFGVPYFEMFDSHPGCERLPVNVTVRGTITFGITDCRMFVDKHALVNFDMESFKAKIKGSVISSVQTSMMDIHHGLKAMNRELILIQINTYRRDIKRILEGELMDSLSKTYGVTLTELNLTAVEVDQDSENYKRLAALTIDISEKITHTQAGLGLRGMSDTYDMQKKGLEAQQDITLEHMAESAKINREEGQYAQHMQTDMGGFALHQLKQQEAVAKAAAGAMGQMGQGGGISMGGAGAGAGGFNPGAMMAGMSMGSAVGQGMAGMMGNVFNQMGQQMPGMAPPPMPGGVPPMGGAPAAPAAPPPAAPVAASYSIAVNGQTYGPYDMTALMQMAQAGQFTAQSMVWRDGMPGWLAAGTVPDLAPLFAAAPPPPPPAA